MTKKTFKIIGIKRWKSLFRFLKRPLFTKFLIKISDTYKKTLENKYNLISDKKMERKATVHKFLPLLTNESALDNNSKKYIIAGS